MGNYLNFYFIFLCSATLSLLEFTTKSTGRIKPIIIATLCFLFIIIGFRGNFDSDYLAYTEIFNSVNFDSASSFAASFHLNVEALFVITMMLLKAFFLGPQSIFVACAFLSLSINWYYCLRWIAYPSLVVLGLLSHSFLYREFTEIRHGVAGALCIASFFRLSDGRTRSAFSLQAVAIFFHSATLFVIGFSILFCWLPRRKFIYACSAIGLFFYFIGFHSLLEQVTTLIPLPESVTVYIQSEYDYHLGLLNPTLIKQSLFMAIFLMSAKYLNIEKKLYFDLLSFYYISIIWLFGSNEFAMFAGRLASFYGVLEVYLISMILPNIKNRLARFGCFSIIVLFYFLQFYMNIEYAKNIFFTDYIFFE